MWSRGLIANTQNSWKHSQCGFTVVAPALIQSPNLIYFKYPDSLWDQISMTSIQRHQNQPSQHSHVIGWRSRKAFPELYILLVSSVCFRCFSALQHRRHQMSGSFCVTCQMNHIDFSCVTSHSHLYGLMYRDAGDSAGTADWRDGRSAGEHRLRIIPVFFHKMTGYFPALLVATEAKHDLFLILTTWCSHVMNCKLNLKKWKVSSGPDNSNAFPQTSETCKMNLVIWLHDVNLPIISFVCILCFTYEDSCSPQVCACFALSPPVHPKTSDLCRMSPSDVKVSTSVTNKTLISSLVNYFPQADWGVMS